LRSIYSRSRSLDEVTREIAALRDKISERRDAYEQEYARTSQIIQSRFDENVQRVFKRLRDDLPAALADLDRDIAVLVDGYLASLGVPFDRTEVGGRVVFDISEQLSLPEELGPHRRFATGDARGHGDAEPLNLMHPLVKAAVRASRLWAGGSIDLHLPVSAGQQLGELAGRTGTMRLVLVDYGGFEPVQHLVPAAVVDGAPIDPLLAHELMRLHATDGQTVASDADLHWLGDAIEEAVFVDQRVVETDEQRHFEQAAGQLERFVEDKALVCRTERASIAEKLTSARERRDHVVGASTRERVEEEISRLATADEMLERRIQALESREDEVYRKWHDKYHELRYQPPTVTTLFQVMFRVSPPTPERSC
ncbi:MAG: hypothetical protein ACRD2A_15790, partial [Vicinamibacterales bacterium]